jgi:tetratricopeptide (TPR) repeat protein
MSGAFFLVWTVTSQQTRFLMPLAPAAAVATAFVVMRGFGGRFVLNVLVRAAAGWIIIASAYGEIHNRFTNNALVPYNTGWLDRLGILDMGVQYYQAVNEANRVVPEGHRVLFLGGDENYYCRKPLICSSIYDRCAAGEMARLAKSPEDLLHIMRKRGISHILYHEPRADEYYGRGMFDWGEDVQKRFLAFWGTYCRLIYQSRGVFLFEVEPRPVPAALRKSGTPLCFMPVPVITRARELMSAADGLFRAEKFKEGFAATQELVKVVPNLAHAYSYRAYAWGGMRNTENSMKDYLKSISLGYPTVAAYYNLGLLYEQVRRPQDALATYLQGLSVERNYNQLKERTAELAFTMGKYPLAFELYSQLQAALPDKPQYPARLRELKLRMGGVLK